MEHCSYFLLPLAHAQPDFFLLCSNIECVSVSMHMSAGAELNPPGAGVKSGHELPDTGADPKLEASATVVCTLNY